MASKQNPQSAPILCVDNNCRQTQVCIPAQTGSKKDNELLHMQIYIYLCKSESSLCCLLCLAHDLTLSTMETGKNGDNFWHICHLVTAQLPCLLRSCVTPAIAALHWHRLLQYNTWVATQVGLLPPHISSGSASTPFPICPVLFHFRPLVQRKNLPPLAEVPGWVSARADDGSQFSGLTGSSSEIPPPHRCDGLEKVGDAPCIQRNAIVPPHPAPFSGTTGKHDVRHTVHTGKPANHGAAAWVWDRKQP